MTETSTAERLRVDTHVHMHACFDENRFLDAAAANLGVLPSACGRVSGVLCLTETSDTDWFQRINADIPRSTGHRGRWRFESAGEPMTVLATDAANRRIAIVAGRQIVTGEGLEVLALGLADRFADGHPTAETLARVAEAGAIPVLPWGFGKWTGRRGKLVAELIASPPCAFFLGDNGGRLAITAEPPAFAEGRARGFRILPGTDPFPFRWDAGRVGSFGLEWDENLGEDKIFLSLRNLLGDSQRAPRRYGHLERLPAFVRNQVAIQARKWARKLRS